MSSQPEFRFADSDLLSERRDSTRFPKEPGTDFAMLWLNEGDEQLVEVHDESLGGISVVVSSATNLVLGAEAMLIYHNDVLLGKVRHMDVRPDGTCLVGFECQ